jgi:hypothetical protein
MLYWSDIKILLLYKTLRKCPETLSNLLEHLWVICLQDYVYVWFKTCFRLGKMAASKYTFLTLWWSRNPNWTTRAQISEGAKRWTHLHLVQNSRIYVTSPIIGIRSEVLTGINTYHGTQTDQYLGWIWIHSPLVNYLQSSSNSDKDFQSSLVTEVSGSISCSERYWNGWVPLRRGNF